MQISFFCIQTKYKAKLMDLLNLVLGNTDKYVVFRNMYLQNTFHSDALYFEKKHFCLHLNLSSIHHVGISKTYLQTSQISNIYLIYKSNIIYLSYIYIVLFGIILLVLSTIVLFHFSPNACITIVSTSCNMFKYN